MAQDQFFLHIHSAGQSPRLGLGAQRQQFCDFLLQQAFQFQQALVTDRFAFRGVRVDLAAVQANPPQLQDVRLFCHQQHLHKQVSHLRQEGLAKIGNRVVIRMPPTRDVAKGNAFVGGPFDLARTEHAADVTVQQQAQQYFRRIRLSATRRILRVDRAQIQHGNHGHDETGQMIGRQALRYGHGLLQRGCVIDGFELSSHTAHFSTNWVRCTHLWNFSPTDC